jgi:anaerobic ribonucleoside-triphosphate reductase activating protein
MLKYTNYNVVFQEVPNEVTLAINISGCPNKCKGCHSPYLMQDIGEWLTISVLDNFIVKYGESITCICFMGGDNNPKEVEHLATHIKQSTHLKTAWYSGKNLLPDNISPLNFNFIKLGPYIQELGALKSPTTNQRFYEIINGKMVDKTHLF